MVVGLLFRGMILCRYHVVLIVGSGTAQSKIALVGALIH